MKIYLYAHGGSGNKGCEAIVRSTLRIMNQQNIVLQSYNVQEDLKAGLNKLCPIIPGRLTVKRRGFVDIAVKLFSIVFRTQFLNFYIMNYPFRRINYKGAAAFSIGGDNYCYDGGLNLLSRHNKKVKKDGGLSVLWGCSIEQERIDNKLLKDLKKYDLITIRENITFKALKRYELKNIYYCPDPAFVLQPQIPQIKKWCHVDNAVGINISPHIIQYSSNKKLVMKNFENLVNWVLNETDMNIIFLPHVEKTRNNDLDIMKPLYEKYSCKNRVYIIDEYMNCEEMKYTISKLRLFIGARTHATIAAYSSCVPTLVMGYSVKALGIANDIWNSEKNYVVDTRNLQSSHILLDLFKDMIKNEAQLKNHLERIMPQYIAQTWTAKDLFEAIIRKNNEKKST